MDPKTTTTLDPKLKETYERVMQTNISPASPTGGPVSSNGSTTPIQASGPAIFQTPPLQHPATKATTTFVAVAPAHQSLRRLLPVLLFLGAVTFFVFYSLFWINFFGLSVPFLPF